MDQRHLFCPICGEPSLRLQYGSVYACRSCHRAGEVFGFEPNRRIYIHDAAQAKLNEVS